MMKATKDTAESSSGDDVNEVPVGQETKQLLEVLNPVSRWAFKALVTPGTGYPHLPIPGVDVGALPELSEPIEFPRESYRVGRTFRVIVDGPVVYEYNTLDEPGWHLHMEQTISEWKGTRLVVRAAWVVGIDSKTHVMHTTRKYVYADENTLARSFILEGRAVLMAHYRDRDGVVWSWTSGCGVGNARGLLKSAAPRFKFWDVPEDFRWN